MFGTFLRPFIPTLSIMILWRCWCLW